MSSLENGEIHYLILAGGRGTRSENPKIAKLLQEVYPTKRILDLLLDNLDAKSFSRVSFLISHLGNSIERELSFIKQRLKNWTVDCIFDPHENSGTAISVANAVQQSNSKYFCLIFGDTACLVNFEILRSQWEHEKYEAAFVVHPNLHPWDSDRLEVDQNGLIRNFYPKSETLTVSQGPLRSVSGMIFFKRSACEKLTITHDDIVPELVMGLPKNKVSTINSSYYQKDAGTPVRMQEIRKDFDSGTAERRGRRIRPAIFLDRDGTIIADRPKGRLEVLPTEVRLDSIIAIRRANSLGIPIFLITNQPGIAKGFISESDVLHVQAQLEGILLEHGAYVDDFRFCPHHPEKGFADEIRALKIVCNCRKPGIGMVTNIASKHGLDLSNSVLIGDSEVDQQTALNAGMTFISANYLKENSLESAITTSIEGILNVN